MPGGDRTGPMGYGPMTGRGAGFCAGYAAPGYANPYPGRGMMGGGRFGRGRGGGGFGMGRGRRMGMGQPYQPLQMDQATESQYLEDEISNLKDNLKRMEERLTVLKKTED